MSAILEFAERLRAQADIADVVGQYVELRRMGQNHKGLCPFHREKTPSFTVSAGKQIFHCFGCGAGGDVIRFVQQVEKIEWMDALKMLAERYRMELPALDRSPDAQARRSEREQILSATQMAFDFYQQVLRAAAKAGDAEIGDYLDRRGLDADLVKRFGLGLAPTAWDGLIAHGAKNGADFDLLEKAGLVIFNAEKNRRYDRFRRRLIFPISDSSGRPVAFGARVFASDARPDEPKYINSPETPLYHKGSQLYALNIAREPIARHAYALIMEGYMDVIRAHQHGFDNAVATCGTALTDEQARLLRKVCRRVVFVYDGDEAGQKAMLRGCETLLAEEFEINVVALPADDDPDSFLQREGTDALRARIDTAPDFFDFFLSRAREKLDPNSPQGRAKIADMLLPLLKCMANPVARAGYMQKLAGHLGVEEGDLRRLVERRKPPQRSAPSGQGGDDSQDSSGSTDDATSSLLGAVGGASVAERQLLRCIVDSQDAMKHVCTMLDPEWFQEPIVQRCLEYILESTDGNVNWSLLLRQFESDPDVTVLRSLAVMDTTRDPIETDATQLATIVARIRRAHHMRARMQEWWTIDEQSRLNPDAQEFLDLLEHYSDGASLTKHLLDTSRNYKPATHVRGSDRATPPPAPDDDMFR